MISGLVLKERKGELFVIHRGYETTLPGSSQFLLTVTNTNFRALNNKSPFRNFENSLTVAYSYNTKVPHKDFC